MKPTLSTAAASGSVSLGAVVILQWLLGSHGIQIPADVATAMGTLLSAGVHCLVAREKPSSQIVKENVP
jgi:hypothetical protein